MGLEGKEGPKGGGGRRWGGVRGVKGLDLNLERKTLLSTFPRRSKCLSAALTAPHPAVLHNIQYLCITDRIISFSHWLQSLAFNQLFPNTQKNPSQCHISACRVLRFPCQGICKSIALTILSSNYLQMPVMSPTVNAFLINNASGSGEALFPPILELQ